MIDDYTISVFRRRACDNFVNSPDQLSRTKLMNINIITLSVGPDKFDKIRQLIDPFIELLQQ